MVKTSRADKTILWLDQYYTPVIRNIKTWALMAVVLISLTVIQFVNMYTGTEILGIVPNVTDETIWGASGETVRSISLTLTLIGALAGLTGTFLLGAKIREAYYVYVICYLGYGLNAIMWGFAMSLVMYIFLFIMLTYQYVTWNKGSGGEVVTSIGARKTLAMLLLAIALIILIGTFHPTLDDWLKYADAAVFVLVLSAFFLTSLNKQEGYFFMYLSNIALVIFYMGNGTPTSALAFFFYMIIDVTSLSTWRINYKENELEENIMDYIHA